MTSPYAAVGPQLVDQGYAAVPCQPGTKYPGTLNFGEWYPAIGWNRYCDRLPTDIETSIWSKWPDAGVCIVMDHTLKVVDIDTDDADMRAAIMAVLPPSSVAKAGAKGLSLFFRGSAAIEARSFNVGKLRVLDLIAYGKQTVIPPTVHPDTGQPYRWLDEPLSAYGPEDLPELPDNIIELIEEALAPFGYSRPVARDPVQGDADTAWREVNNIALSRLVDWVPDLGLPRLKASGDGYRAVAIYRPSGSGKPLHKRNLHLAINPKGIVDFGDNDTPFTPISLVMAVSRCNFGEAFDWLRDRLGLTPATIDVSALIRNGLAKKQAETVTQEQIDLHVASMPAPSPVSNGGLVDDLTRPPGLVGDITDWLTATARNPSRTLNLGAALAFVGALAGRRYEGPTGLRSNVYVVGLAPSGFGKEHARSATKILATKAGVLSKFFGGEQIMSATALRARIKHNPSLVYMVDEFGGFLRKITNPRGSNHEREIGDDLLKLTGAASSVFLGADYAQALAEPLHSPNVCIYGTSTPETFWGALGSGNIADGFLPRFVVLDAGTVRPEPRDIGAPEVPDALAKAVQAVTVHPNGGNLSGMTSNGTTAVVPIKVPWTDEARRHFVEFQGAMYRRMETSPTEFEPILARVAENAGRLALIVAVGCDPLAAEITEPIMGWAAAVAEQSARMLMDQAEDRVADNDRQAEYKRVRKIVAETRGKGITRNDVSRRLKGVMDRRRMHDVIDQLVEAGEIVERTHKPTSGGRESKVLWAVGCEPRPPVEQPEEAA